MRLLSLAASFLAAALSSRADTFLAYNLDATLQQGSVTGTLLFDLQRDGFVGNLDATVNGTSYLLNQGFGTPGHFDGYYFFTASDSEGDNFYAMFADFPGYLCSLTVPCGYVDIVRYSVFTLADSVGTAGEDLAVSGSISDATTPEPSSFLLLGTGMLGLAGVMRKRLA